MRQPSTNLDRLVFTPWQFGLLLALLIFAAFPQVILGVETFIARDFGFFAYPLAQFQKECFWRGEIPFWDPYNNCGVPFLAQWNTMPLYPPSLIYLTLPLGWSLSFFSLLHVWWAGFGMYFLARRWSGNAFAAAFAGTAFAFNGFTLNLIMWPSHIATFSWMPWVIFAVEAAWREGGKKIPLAACVGALQMLAGGPETIFLTWLIATALWLQQFAIKDTPRTAMLWRFPLLVLLVFSLAAAQLLPFLDLAAHSQRETGFTDLRWSMPRNGLANFLVPMAFGSTHVEGIFFQRGQYWTSSYYLGIGTLWLALLALFRWRERRVWFLAMIAIIGLLCALGGSTPFYPLLRKLIPQLSFITYPVKYVMVVIFAAPLLAAFALANLKNQLKQFFPLGAMLLFLISIVIAWTQFGAHPGEDTHAALLNGFSRAGFWLATGAGLFAVTREKKAIWFRFAPLVLLLMMWLDVWTHEPNQNPTVTPEIFKPNAVTAPDEIQPRPRLGGTRAMLSPDTALQFISVALNDPRKNFQVKRFDLCADVNLLDAMPKVDGFFSLTPKEFDELLSQIYGGTNYGWSHLEDFMGVSQTNTPDYYWQARGGFMPLLTAGQKPYFVNDTNAFASFTWDDFDGRKGVYLQPQDKSLVTVSNQTSAKILKSQFGNNTVDADVEAAEPSLVVVAQTYYHNWCAEIDGVPAPVLRANVAFQAVPVPAGTHKVHLFYRDRAFQVGAAIALGGWSACLIIFLVLHRRDAAARQIAAS